MGDSTLLWHGGGKNKSSQACQMMGGCSACHGPCVIEVIKDDVEGMTGAERSDKMLCLACGDVSPSTATIETTTFFCAMRAGASYRGRPAGGAVIEVFQDWKQQLL